MPKISFADQMYEWEVLATTVQRFAQELPTLQPLREELAAAFAEAQKAHADSLRLRARLSLAHERARQAQKRGEEAARRLRRLLQATYGTDSSLLIRHGLKPYRAQRGPQPLEPDASELALPGEPEES